MNPERLLNERERGPDVYADSMSDNISRWDYMRDDRAEWTREAWRDKCVIAGKTFNKDEEAFYRDAGRDVPNYNLAMSMINTIAGTEAQNRADIKYQPIGPGDVDGAESATFLARKVARSNQMGRKFSGAFGDALNTGIGWVETGYNRYVTGDPVVIDQESSMNVWVDPASRKPDLTDAADLCRMKLLRPKQLARLLPKDMHPEIRDLRGVEFNGFGQATWNHSADYTNDHGDRPDVNDDEWGSTRGTNGADRLLEVVERWYRVDRHVDIVKHNDGRWWEVLPENAYRLAEMIVDGEAYEDSGLVQEMRYALFCEDWQIGDFASPYKHRRFPLVPIWCYRDEFGRPMSIARMIRTAAKDFNARMANLLQRALMRQVWMEEGATSDVDRTIEEMGMMDGLVMLKPGSIKNQRVLFRDELEASAVEAQLLQMDLKFITDLAGVTDEMAGRRGNADSGVGIKAKIAQSQTSLYTLFDNRTWALGEVATLLLSCIQEKYTREMAIRVTERNKGIDWITINKREMGADGVAMIVNDITQVEYDVEVSEVPLTESLRMAQFEALASFLTPMPTEVKLLFASKMADLADIPDAAEVSQKLEEFAQRVLGTQGQPPPIDPAFITMLVQEGQLTPEGAQALLAQLAQQVAGQPQGNPGAQPTGPTPQGPGAQPGLSAPTPAAPPAVA